MLALEGARVVATDIQKELGLHLVDDIVADGGEAVFAALDVTDPERWGSVVDMKVSTFGGLDVLINNAGIVTHSGALECSDEEWDHAIAVNQTGTFLGMRAALRPMLAARHGSIVNISSVGGLVGFAGGVAYQASKAAIIGMTRSVAATYGKDGVRANSIAPGAVSTPMLEKGLQELGLDRGHYEGTQPIPRIGQPEEIASAVLFLASDDSSYVTGIVL